MTKFEQFQTRPPGLWDISDVREILADPSISERECKDILRQVLLSKKTYNCIVKQIEAAKK